MQVYKIDDKGFLIGIEHINQDEHVDFEYVTNPLPTDKFGYQLPFYRAKWDGQKWVEGATQAEIDELTSVTLDAIKERKTVELNDACNKTVLGRFKATINNVEYEFSYDYDAQLRFTGIGVMFATNQINEQVWTAYHDGERERIVLDKANFSNVSIAALRHNDYNVTKFNDLLQKVNSATTKEQVEAIVWDE